MAATSAGSIRTVAKGAAKAIIVDITRRRQGWLRDAATRMARLVRADWKDWRAAK